MKNGVSSEVAWSSLTVSAFQAQDPISVLNVIISALLLLVTAISVICAFRAYHHQKDRAKKEAACNLARVYSREIISKYAIITDVFIRSKTIDFIKETFPIDEIEFFSADELEEFSAKREIKYSDITHKMENFDPLCILDVFTENTSSMFERIVLKESCSKVDEGKNKRISNNDTLIIAEFWNTISNTLNTLEWFSMNCRYGLADEELMYQSLHQTFLSTVWMLYYFMSRNNTSNEDKLFTNTVWLFKKWRSRLHIQKKEALCKREVAMRTIASAKDMYINAGSEFAGKPLK